MRGALIALLLIVATIDGAAADGLDNGEERRVIEAALRYYLDQDGFVVLSDLSIGDGLAPSPGHDQIPALLAARYRDVNQTRLDLTDACGSLSDCAVLDYDTQQDLKAFAEAARARALKEGRRLPRRFNPWWAGFAKTYPDAKALLRLTRPAIDRATGQALIGLVRTRSAISGGSALLLLTRGEFGWYVSQTLVGDSLL